MKLYHLFFIFIFFSWEFRPALAQESSQSTLERREEYLRQLKSVLPPDYQRRSDAPPPTPLDSTWSSWQQRSGELPPDFTQLPSLPFLPDPLILDEGGKNIPVKTMEQWYKKRQWIKEQAQHWITGTMPPAPDNLKASLVDERKLGDLTEQDVLLEFGPAHKAKLNITLLIPPGEGPFPVFMCPWKKDRYDWVQAAVRRGYMAVRFRATDPKYGHPDDSEAYAKIYWPAYDFTTIGRWAWSVSRTIDYLYTRPDIEQEQIALTGLSRNGKMSLWAAAYDERIKAVVPISGGTGGENPFRYTSDKYDNETIELLSRWQPHWLHPRIRFFVGREHKLPVDQNSLMALIAPRGLMLSSSITESQGGPWGIEQAYLSAKKNYEFLGADNKIALDLRHGLHAPSARDMERYLDFFDYIFGRGSIMPHNQQYYSYSFSRWLGLSEELIDPLAYKSKGIDNILVNQEGKKISSVPEWEQKEKEVEHWLDWVMGNEPPSLGPGKQSDYMREVVGLPDIPPDFGSRAISFGQLYFPHTEDGKPAKKDLPLVIYLHEYSYTKGFVKSTDIIKRFLEAGFAVYAFDQIGFGSRIEEGKLFYERFPHWSKLGRMVSDVRWAIDELSQIEFLDKDKMMVAGYSLGATVGLYTAAKDDRIAGVISVCGFSPMRLNRVGKTAEGIYGYSHLHGLLPRLGFFADNEDRIPYDYHEILATIAPRPLLVIAPNWDQYNAYEDVKMTVLEAKKVFALYHSEDNLQLKVPEDYNRLSSDTKALMVKWAKENFVDESQQPYSNQYKQ